LALEDVKHLVDEPGTAFRLTCIATLVGATAIVIWLADQITRHGLGSGVWLLLVTPWLAEIPARIAGLAASWSDWGPAVSVLLLIGCAVSVLVLAAIMRLLKAGGAPREMAATSLWSVLLADAAWPWLILVVALIAGGGGLQDVGSWLNPAHPFALLVLAGLVVVFTHLYLRSQRMAGVTSFSAIPSALVGAALAAIALADMVVATQMGLVPLAGHLILIAVVALSLLARWWQPPFDEAGQPEPDDEPA
jgi:preprotein translocase subunit SecY